MIFLLSFFLYFQIIPVSSQLNIIGIDFVALVPDSETDIFLNPANIFFLNKIFLFSFSSYHPYLYLTQNSPISFQTFFNVKMGKENCFLNIAYHYLFTNEKMDKKTYLFNYHNLPFGVGYNLGEIKIGLGGGYQEFYFKEGSLREKKRYLPFKIGFATEEERLEIGSSFILFKTNNFNGYQLNFTLRKIIGEINKHNFLLEITYQQDSVKNWKFVGGYCLLSSYNFYGFVFNNFFSLKPILFMDEKKNFDVKVIFPYGLVCSFGKMKFLFGLKKELIFNRENVYSTDYEYNFGLSYYLSNNFVFYFFNLPFKPIRKWFFSFKISL